MNDIALNPVVMDVEVAGFSLCPVALAPLVPCASDPASSTHY